MAREKGHASFSRRIAINVGAGFVPGMNAVIMGAALAAGKLGWEMVGIRDGFDGLLHPDRYPEGGLVTSAPSWSRTWTRRPRVFWANRRGSIRFMSARSMTTTWSKKWTCPMSF